MLRRLIGKFVRPFPPDFSDSEKNIFEQVKPFTMTTPERVYGLVQAVRYVENRGIEGAIVECGVWRGGSMMAAALTLKSVGKNDRELYLFDTYDGMPAPTDADVDLQGESAEQYYQSHRKASGNSDWCAANVDEVARNMARTGYPKERVHLVQGRVEETIPASAPERIALLRLDTDWFESTFHTLQHLYPRLSTGGVLIIDDYGHWKGSREATDRYFAEAAPPVLLNRLDYTGRIGIKW